MNKRKEVLEVARLFSKLGFIAFGGPAAHIAMMKDEVVRKKQWISEQHFLDLIGITNLIPGPNSTEMAIHIGHERAGWKGLIIAGICFILPAVFITGFIAYLYKQYGQLPQIQPYTYGIKPAVIAIILGAIYPLAKRSIKTAKLGLIGLATLILCLLGFNEIYVMFGAGLFVLAVSFLKYKSNGPALRGLIPLTFLKATGSSTTAITNAGLFFSFLKIGSILYGSGYVLFAFLNEELVTRGIITRQQLIDAIAIGQFTPGPVFSAVTFIGYQVNGIAGAVLATAGVFLPSFILIALLNPLIPKMRRSKLFSSFLDAVNVASVAIIIAVCYQMGKEVITDWRTILIAVMSLILTFGFRKINTALIVLAGSITGLLLSFV